MRDLMQQKYFLKSMYDACEIRIDNIVDTMKSENDMNKLQELDKEKREIASRIISIEDTLRYI